MGEVVESDAHVSCGRKLSELRVTAAIGNERGWGSVVHGRLVKH